MERRMARIKKFLLRTCKSMAKFWNESVTDSRKKQGKRWSLATLLNGMLIGLCMRLITLREVERMTDELVPTGGRLDIRGRISDTTFYHLLTRLNWEEMREGLHAEVDKYYRSKTIRDDSLPIACTAIDGKTVLCDSKKMSRFAQKAEHNDGRVTYNLRVLRAIQTSSIFRPCIDQMPVPPETNEQGAFHAFFADLVKRGKRNGRFELFTLDSGYCYLPLADRIDQEGYAYLIALKMGQPELIKEAERILLRKMKNEMPEAVLDWEIHGSDRVKRELWRTMDMAGYPTTSGEWRHLRQVWVVRTTRRKSTGKEETSLRYFVTNLPRNRLNADECLSVVRAHWAVEDDCFWTLDKEWQEDLRAWCLKEEAVLCQSYLRILAYNICQIIRRRRGRYRKDGSREWPSWDDIFHWVERALTYPIAEWALQIEGLAGT
jgi:hypothetical protein